MAWLQSEVPFGRMKETEVQEALYQCSLAEAAAGKLDRRIGLFSREQRFEKTILLLSPEAAKYAPHLPGSWTEEPDPARYRWAVLYTAGATLDDFGLRSEQLGGAAEG